MSDPKENSTVSFKDTLNLPHTDFPIRPNSKEDDPAMLARWEKEKLYDKAFAHNQGKATFILHDGPPYANGNIHLGHAYNKILKDIATKSHRMMGMHVPVIPGWDCHGLPIEIKVTQENPNLSRPALLTACRSYASKWIDIQRNEFKSLGVVMQWDTPYLTMNFSYEAKELKALGQFVTKGYIKRSNKTVPWCANCKTVLATAEIEYEDRKDPSIYVLFPLVMADQKKIFPDMADQVSLVAWTTTPWTLPLNRAILIKPDTDYAILDINGKNVMVAKSLVERFCKTLGVSQSIVGEVSSAQLAGLSARHPFIENLVVPIIQDGSVMLDEGTAFVHCAPGAGPQDYETGIKNNLEIFSPVAPDGTYAEQIQPSELVGMSIEDGQIWVLKTLAAHDRLLYKTSIRHSYPHCWRCHKGLIFRATKQWFFNLEKEDLKERVLEASNSIATLPEKSINRLQATIEGRLEWCISRQRVWGVPIPALICNGCDQTFINQQFIDKVAQGIAQEGVEYWQNVAIAELVGSDFSCEACKGSSFTKEKDILDVWFDSGLSHYMVLYENPQQAYPASLYLEGKDQHRGWFQSALLTSMALEGTPAMKMIITHGFTVDEKGQKMSKSLGNVVAPQEIIEKLGTDGLRLWASSIDFAGEAVVSEIVLQNVQEVFRKVRNTCRFLLSNLYDFDIDLHAVDINAMRTIDQHALVELYDFNDRIIKAYQAYDYTNIYHQFGVYASVNLSAFYFEMVKDCLYVDETDGHARRSVQTACWYILDTLTRLIAPIFSFTAEQISDLYQKDKNTSIHLQEFNKLTSVRQNSSSSHDYSRNWHTLKQIRSAILKATEELREKNIIKRSLDARITLFVDPAAEYKKDIDIFFELLKEKGETIEQFFKDFAILSQFVLATHKKGLDQSALPGLFIIAEKAYGHKCPRCWQWSENKNEYNLCERCEQVVAAVRKKS